MIIRVARWKEWFGPKAIAGDGKTKPPLELVRFERRREFAASENKRCGLHVG
jgi:hypothetical protein